MTVLVVLKPFEGLPLVWRQQVFETRSNISGLDVIKQPCVRVIEFSTLPRIAVSAVGSY